MKPLSLPGPVRVWQVDLDQAEAPRSLLSPDERARADRFRFDRDRHRYTAGRAALRHLLGEALGSAAGRVRFTYSPQGKPACEIPFNLSHSENLALIALGGSDPLGVDLEVVRGDLDPLTLGRSVFTREEMAALAACPESERHRAFFSAWTQKEALIKAEGGGFSSPLLARTVWPRPEPGVAERFTVQSLPLAAGLAGALAIAKKTPGDCLAH